jgi:hypothetical protein
LRLQHFSSPAFQWRRKAVGVVDDEGHDNDGSDESD